MEISKLSDRLAKTANNSYGPEDQDWVQFVKDHISYLRENSPVKVFTTFDMVKYKYRPIEFFTDNRGDINQVWIFLMVNDLHDPSDFNESIKRLWVVDTDQIKKLRQRYESSAQYQAKQRQVGA